MANTNFTNISRYPLGKVVDILSLEVDAISKGYTNLVPVIAGSPGIGKSATLKWLADQKNLNVLIISLGAVPYEYLSGLPDFVETEYFNEIVKAAKWSVPDIIDSINKHTENALANGKDGLLVLLDDIHLMEPAAQKYMFEFFQNKTLQNFKIRDEAILIGAMNESGAAGFEDMYSAILDRISLYFVDFDFDFWYKNIGIDLHPSIAAFSKTNEASILGAEATNEVTASPRSWTEFSNMLNYLENEVGLSINDALFKDKAIIMGKGKVGTTETTKFIEFLVTYTRFNFIDIFENKKVDYEIPDDFIDQVLHAFMVRYVTSKEDVDILIEIMFENKDKTTFFSKALDEVALLYGSIRNIKDRKKKNVIKYIKDKIKEKRDPEVLKAFNDILI